MVCYFATRFTCVVNSKVDHELGSLHCRSRELTKPCQPSTSEMQPQPANTFSSCFKKTTFKRWQPLAGSKSRAEFEQRALPGMECLPGTSVPSSNSNKAFTGWKACAPLIADHCYLFAFGPYQS